jgi:hypothetical protein
MEVTCGCVWGAVCALRRCLFHECVDCEKNIFLKNLGICTVPVLVTSNIFMSAVLYQAKKSASRGSKPHVQHVPKWGKKAGSGGGTSSW